MGVSEPRIRRRRPGDKTYSHLLQRARVPTEYELTSSALLYHPAQGLAVDNPVADWMRRYQTQSALGDGDWERFADPRATTYFSYCALARERQAIFDDLFRRATLAGPTGSPGWIEERRILLGSLRFVCHALQMGTAYLGSMAPAGTIAIAAALQCADEIGRIHALARHLYAVEGLAAEPSERRRTRLRQLACESREAWEQHPAWQSLRAVLERLLVTYDWGECFAAMNLVIKPLIDAFCREHIASRARDASDILLADLLVALDADAAWQREWSLGLVSFARDLDPNKVPVLRMWVEKWAREANAAIVPLAGTPREPLDITFRARLAASLEGRGT